MTMQRLRIVAVMTCFLVVLGSAPAVGQTADDLANLRDVISRNAELLMMARDLVRETNSVKARASLAAAAKLHQASLDYLKVDLLRAGQLAKHAREAILQTIALAKREAKLEENAFKAMERAAHRLEQAKQLLAESRDALPARKLAEEAYGLLRRSQDNMREHLFEVALRLAISSEHLSTRAIAMLKRDFSDLDSIKKELEKTDRVLERVAEQFDGNADTKARRMFEEAKELQRKAKNSFRSDNPRRALELTRRARQLATRALKMLATRANRENVQQAIRLTDMLVAEAKEILARRDVQRLQRKIEQAEDLQREAKRRFERGNFERALNLTLKARRLLREALASVKQVLNKREVRRALVETDEILARLKGALEGSDSDIAPELYKRARANQEKAWREFDDDRLRAALAHTKLARRLARNALRQLRDDDL
ncbi:MAG: hypothetical protein V3V49_12630 [Candidatus Krumholzibacteria bacterium]